MDSLKNTHSIESKISKTGDIHDMFDAISYAKGSCIIRFLVNYLGKDKFQLGIRNYIRKNAYKNTTTLDLWNCFNELLETEKVDTVMDDWLKQEGYPIIKVKKNNNIVTITQNKFNSNDDTLWITPIRIKCCCENNNGDIKCDKQMLILKNKTTIYTLTEEHANCEIILNSNRFAFARILYEDDIQMDYLTRNNISYLIDDYFVFAENGICKFDKVFKILNKLSFDECSYLVWLVIIKHVKFIYNAINSKQENKYLENVIYNLCNALFVLGYKEVNNEMGELIRETLVFFKHKKTINIGLERYRNDFYDNWIYKRIIYKIVGKYGTVEEYKKLLSQYKTETNEFTKNEMFVGLANAGINNEKIAINNIYTDIIRDQDLSSYIAHLVSNNDIKTNVLANIYDNWNYFVNKFTVHSHNMSNIIKCLGMGSTSKECLDKFNNFALKNNISDLSVVLQTREKIENTIKLYNIILNDELFK